MSFFIGVELGQVSDVTAIAVVQSETLEILRTETTYEDRWVDIHPVYRGRDGKETREHPPVTFALRHLERLQPGVSYPEIVARTEALRERMPSPTVLVDATGVGAATVELFRASSLSPYAVTLIAGDQFVQDGSRLRVPKRDVISTTQVLLQSKRLRIARALPHATLLVRELLTFRARTSRDQPADALDWREGPEDDLVLALAIAAWQAERNPGLGGSFGFMRPISMEF